MMKWLNKHFWETITAHIFVILIGGALLAITGFTPEEWIKLAINQLPLSVIPNISIPTLALAVRILLGSLGVLFIVVALVRWQRLRGLWWFWSVFGLSGGIAVALWLTPLLSPQTTPTPPPTTQVANQARQPSVGYFGDQYTGNATSAIDPRRITSIKAWRTSNYRQNFIRVLQIHREWTIHTDDQKLGDVSGDNFTEFVVGTDIDNNYIVRVDIYRATGIVPWLVGQLIIGMHIATKNGHDGNLGDAEGSAVLICRDNDKMLTGFYVRYKDVITGMACSFELPPT